MQIIFKILQPVKTTILDVFHLTFILFDNTISKSLDGKEKYWTAILSFLVILRMMFESTFTLFRLDHPNVVKLQEAYESKASVYLVMEL